MSLDKNQFASFYSSEDRCLCGKQGCKEHSANDLIILNEIISIYNCVECNYQITKEYWYCGQNPRNKYCSERCFDIVHKRNNFFCKRFKKHHVI